MGNVEALLGHVTVTLFVDSMETVAQTRMISANNGFSEHQMFWKLRYATEIQRLQIFMNFANFVFAPSLNINFYFIVAS